MGNTLKFSHEPPLLTQQPTEEHRIGSAGIFFSFQKLKCGERSDALVLFLFVLGVATPLLDSIYANFS